jgi:phenylpropionate dioxygenase-like ring-hydroxylating dioxygenase large terminal subunit
MEHQTQIRLLERVLDHVRNGTTDIFEQPEPFSRRIYNTPERFAAERDVLFRRFPLVVGFSSQIREPGDYFTHDLTGVPILVVRRPDGVAVAHLNSCRHRGAKVTSQPAGSGCRRFICPYHAWSYDLDGQLHSVTEKRCFPNLVQAQSGLVSLPCAERHGMIFVVPTPGVPLDIDAYLGKFGDDFASYGLDKYQVTATKNTPGQIDWKMMVEANQENYHINFLHGRTAGRRYLDQCSASDLDAPHSRSVLVHASTGRVPMPEDRSRWSLLDYGDLVYFIFPNTLALWAGGGVQVISPFPQALGHSIMQGARLDPPTATSRAAREYSAAFYGNYWQTIMEDIRVSETIQIGAAGPADVLLQLGGNERPLAEFNNHVDRAIAGEMTLEMLNARRRPAPSASALPAPLAPPPAVPMGTAVPAASVEASS